MDWATSRLSSRYCSPADISTPWDAGCPTWVKAGAGPFDLCPPTVINRLVLPNNSGRIPNRAGIGPFLDDHRDLILRFDLVELGLISGPARSWNFQDAGIVRGTHLGIEFRIGPGGDRYCNQG